MINSLNKLINSYQLKTLIELLGLPHDFILLKLLNSFMHHFLDQNDTETIPFEFSMNISIDSNTLCVNLQQNKI